MLEHRRFHSALPLYTILSLYPCRVQADAKCTQNLSQWFASMTAEPRSAGGRLQWLGNRELTAHNTLEWSIRTSNLTTCTKSRRRLSHRTVKSCVWLVPHSTSVLVTHWRCEMCRSLLKHHCGHASSFFSSTEVTDHVSLSRLRKAGLEEHVYHYSTSSHKSRTNFFQESPQSRHYSSKF